MTASVASSSHAAASTQSDSTLQSLLGLPASTHPLTAFDAAELSHLTSLSLSELQHRPVTLRSNLASTTHDLQQTAVNHYTAFLSVDSAHSSVSNSLHRLDSLSTQLLNQTLPVTLKSMQHTLSSASSSCASQSQMRQMIHSTSTLLELLDMPSLMQQCLSHSLIEEAMELHQFALRQRASLSHSNEQCSVLDCICEEMTTQLDSTRQLLVQQLQGGIDLAHALRHVGQLRRILVILDQCRPESESGSIDRSRSIELHLRRLFVESRNDWLCTRLSSIHKHLTDGRHYDYLLAYLDTMRTCLFDLVTQYRAVFVDDGEAKTTVLEAWCAYRIELLLRTLNACLQHIGLPGDSLTATNQLHTASHQFATLLDTASYLGASLARCGCDCRSLLVECVENRIAQFYCAEQGQVHALFVPAFTDALSRYVWYIDHSQLVKIGLSLPVDTQQSSEQQRLDAILSCPPLAVLVNGAITLCNSLRQCACESIKQQLARAVHAALVQCVTVLRQFELPVLRRKVECSNHFIRQQMNESIDAQSASSSKSRLCDAKSLLARTMSYSGLPHIASIVNQVFAPVNDESMSKSQSSSHTNRLIDITSIQSAIRILHADEDAEIRDEIKHERQQQQQQQQAINLKKQQNEQTTVDQPQSTVDDLASQQPPESQTDSVNDLDKRD